MKRLTMVFIALLIAVSVTLAGCGGSGITQADLDAVKAQLTTAQSQLTQANAEKSAAQADLQKAELDLNATAKEVSTLEQQAADLEKQIADLSLKGATTLETVTKLVKYYSDTHEYLKDIWDCNNYACDFWDILMKAGINTEEHPTQIIVGSIEKDITSILSSDHAWVLVDLGDGTKIAADATGGIVITKAENPRYYKGWAFNNPADLKANDDLRAAYNARVSVYNALITHINAALNQYNTTFSASDLAVYNKLIEIKNEQKAELDQLAIQIETYSVKL
jgi:hypothetical protein